MPLLRRKKKEQEPSEPPLSFQEAVFRILSPESGTSDGAEEVSFDTYEAALGAPDFRSLLFTYGASNVLRFVLIEPGPSDNAAGEGAASRETRAAARRHLASFLCLDPERSDTEGTRRIEPHFLVEKGFVPERSEAVLWLTAEFRIFRYTGASGEGYLAVDRTRSAHLEKKMEENGEFRRFVRESIETGDFEKGRRENGGGYFDDPSEIPDRIDLARPLDFLAGYTLLPRRAPAGKHTAEARFESIRGAGLEVTGAEDENLTEEIWFTYTCRFG